MNTYDLVITFGGQSLYFDTVLREDHEHAVTITNNAVEAGVVLSDHIYVEPRQIVAEVVVSDKLIQVLPNEYNTAETRSISCFEALSQLQRLKGFVSVQTSLQLYNNMAITRISATRDPQTAKILKAVIEFREVIVASVRSVRFIRPAVERATIEADAPFTPNNNNANRRQLNPDG